ncbi:TcaA 3rd/4th domain-containing protein [Planococcus sp. CAU13]|uniref:TcaA 3rd/4th domain-containing protein n=1 Tax=Planococcus sp. CAU13 TaxID=1541197 RepID=UPI000530098C|nr:zinc ribbon domain-containing protein [Planococcus sp. CAU13]
MKTCSSCGSVSKESDKFCLKCGTKLEANSPVAGKIKEHSISPQQRKRRIWSLVSIALLLIIVGATHLFLQSKFDATKTLISMNQAYSKNDSAEFLSYFSVAEDVEKNGEGFFEFVETEGWGEIRDRLKTEISSLKNEGISNIILDSNDNKFISLVNEPILFGLYNKVSFLLHPVVVEAEIPLDNTTITIGDKTINGNLGQKVNAGKFLPGNYEWLASAPSEYSPIEEKGFAVINGKNGTNYYRLSPALNGGMLTVTSDVEEAILLINGKSTGKTVKEMKSVGPIPFNETVEISAETKDGSSVVKGIPITVKSEKAHIEFAHIQEKESAARAEKKAEEELLTLVKNHEYYVSEFITSFRSDFEYALNYGDFSYISYYFPIGSEIQSEYIADINRHINMSEYYFYDFETTFITNVEPVNINTLRVTTEETFVFTSGLDTYQYYRTKAYTVNVQEDGYSISNIEQLTTKQFEI